MKDFIVEKSTSSVVRTLKEAKTFLSKTDTNKILQRPSILFLFSLTSDLTFETMFSKALTILS